MSDDVVRRLAIEQRRRLVASLMQFAEGSAWWKKLSDRERKEFRDKVLGSIGSYHDFMLDVLKVNREDMIRNEESLRLIQAVHESQKRLERDLAVR